MFSIRIGAVVVLVVCAMGNLASARRDQDVDVTQEDARVISAIVDDTLREHARRFAAPGALASDPVVMLDRTVDFCEGPDPARPSCRRRAYVEALRDNGTGEPARRAPYPRDLIPESGVREQLIDALVARNSKSYVLHDLPGDVRLVAAGSTLAPRSQERYNAKPYLGVSAPGYSSGSEAAVYAFNRCGVRCGEGWLFVLNRVNGEWRVRGKLSLWIS